MKKLVCSVLLVISLISNLSAGEIEDRGGKFGKKLKDINLTPLMINNNRSSCSTHIWFDAQLHGRWWNYYLYTKVSAYAYTKMTYGSATKNCGAPYKSSRIFIDLFLTNYFHYPVAFANKNGNDILDQKNVNNTSYVKAEGEIVGYGWDPLGQRGSNIMSYHEADIGSHYTFKGTRTVT